MSVSLVKYVVSTCVLVVQGSYFVDGTGSLFDFN